MCWSIFTTLLYVIYGMYFHYMYPDMYITCFRITGVLLLRLSQSLLTYAGQTVTANAGAAWTHGPISCNKPCTYTGNTLREIIRYTCSVYGVLYTVLWLYHWIMLYYLITALTYLYKIFYYCYLLIVHINKLLILILYNVVR